MGQKPVVQCSQDKWIKQQWFWSSTDLNSFLGSSIYELCEPSWFIQHLLMSVFHQENGNVHKKEKLCESLNKNRFKKQKKEEQKGNVCFCYGVNILTCVLYMSSLRVNPLKLHLILDRYIQLSSCITVNQISQSSLFKQPWTFQIVAEISGQYI